jgi:hypothetical protein
MTAAVKKSGEDTTKAITDSKTATVDAIQKPPAAEASVAAAPRVATVTAAAPNQPVAAPATAEVSTVFSQLAEIAGTPDYRLPRPHGSASRKDTDQTKQESDGKKQLAG